MAIDLLTGRVTGRYVFGVVDGADADSEPDMIPAAGTITLTASVQYLPTPGPVPVTVLKTAITGVLDSQGYLCTPEPNNPKVASSVRGVRLIATNNPTLPVQNWTWRVSYNFVTSTGQSAGTIIPQHSISVLANTDLDLTTVVKVPESPAIGVAASEAAAGLAVVSAANAELSAAAAETYAAQIAASGAAASAVTTTTNGLMLFSDKVKLNGIATGATANDSNANLRARSSHTGTQSVDTVSDATVTGKALVRATDAASARTAIGAGTGSSNLAIGTTSTTAMAGNTAVVKTVNGQAPNASGAVTITTGAVSVAAADITDSTSTGQALIKAADAATARTAIGAGTSNLVLGTSTSSAKRGDYTPTKAEVGLSNVDNTSDASKPVSTATQTALNARPLKTSTPFVVKWNGSAWEYASLAAAVTAGLDTNQIIMFIGHPDGTMPAWSRDADIASVG